MSKPKQNNFRNLCNAGLHGNAQAQNRLQGICTKSEKPNAGSYIARKPMQGTLMHGKETMHGLSNAGKRQCRTKTNARLFFQRTAFYCTNPIMHGKNIAGAHKSANPSAKATQNCIFTPKSNKKRKMYKNNANLGQLMAYISVNRQKQCIKPFKGL